MAKVIVDGLVYNFPDDITRTEIIEVLGGVFPTEEEPVKPASLKEPEAPAVGNERNAFDDGFVAGEEVVDEAGVKFRVDKYGRYIEV